MNEPDDADALAGSAHVNTGDGVDEDGDADHSDGDDAGNLYELGAGLVMPHVYLHGIPRPPLSADDRANMEHGVLCLELWIKEHPDSWQGLWVLGKAHQRLGRSERAGEFFLRSHEQNPRHPDVARELVMECISLGRGPEAVHFARTSIALDPDDAQLLTNLALALLISGQVDDALLQANLALARSPADEVTSNVVGYILEVVDGRRPAPTRLSRYPVPS